MQRHVQSLEMQLYEHMSRAANTCSEQMICSNLMAANLFLHLIAGTQGVELAHFALHDDHMRVSSGNMHPHESAI